MKLWLAKVAGRKSVGLIPTDDIATKVLSRMADGECVQIELVRPRSVQWHRLYWGLCRQIGDNQDPARDEDSIDAEIRILSGHFETIFVAGHEVRMPKRIAFNKMSADEWAFYWQKAELAVSERFGYEYLTQVNVA